MRTVPRKQSSREDVDLHFPTYLLHIRSTTAIYFRVVGATCAHDIIIMSHKTEEISEVRHPQDSRGDRRYPHSCPHSIMA